MRCMKRQIKIEPMTRNSISVLFNKRVSLCTLLSSVYKRKGTNDMRSGNIKDQKPIEHYSLKKRNTCSGEASTPTSSQSRPFHLPLIPTSFKAQSPPDSESLGSWQAAFSWSVGPHCSEQKVCVFSYVPLAK